MKTAGATRGEAAFAIAKVSCLQLSALPCSMRVCHQPSPPHVPAAAALPAADLPPPRPPLRPPPARSPRPSQSDAVTREIGGVFVTRQLADDDLGSKQPATVEIEGTW